MTSQPFSVGGTRSWWRMAEKVLKNMKSEVEEKDLKLSIAEGGKEGKSLAMTSCKILEERFQECSVKEGATSVETLEVDLKTRTQAAGSERRRREERSVM